MSQEITYILKEEPLEHLLIEGLKKEDPSMDEKIWTSFSTLVTITPDGIVSLETPKKQSDCTNFVQILYFDSQNLQLPISNDCCALQKKPNKAKQKVTNKYIFCNVNSNDKALIESTRKRNKKRDWDCFVSTYTFR